MKAAYYTENSRSNYSIKDRASESSISWIFGKSGMVKRKARAEIRTRVGGSTIL